MTEGMCDDRLHCARPDEERSLLTAEMIVSFEAIIGLQGGVGMWHLGEEAGAADHHQLMASARDGDVEAIGVAQEGAVEVVGIGRGDREQQDIALRSLWRILQHPMRREEEYLRHTPHHHSTLTGYWANTGS